MEGQVGGVAGEAEKVLDDPGDAVGLGLDLLQDLGEVDVGHLLLQHLDVAGDARQGRIDLVGHARRKQPDGGQLLRGDQLLLQMDFIRDVLEDEDGAVGIEAVVEERRLGHVEDALVAGRHGQGDLAQEAEFPAAVPGIEDGVVFRPHDPLQALADDGVLLLGEVPFQDPVPADDAAVAIEHGDAHGQALDDVLAVVLEPLHLGRTDGGLFVERSVLHGQSHGRSDGAQKLPVLAGQEGHIRFFAHGQAADQLALDLEGQEVLEAVAGEVLELLLQVAQVGHGEERQGFEAADDLQDLGVQGEAARQGADDGGRG